MGLAQALPNKTLVVSTLTKNVDKNESSRVQCMWLDRDVDISPLRPEVSKDGQVDIKW